MAQIRYWLSGVLVAGVGLLSFAGCETTVKKQYVGPDTTVTVNAPRTNSPAANADGTTSGGVSLDEALGTDESVQRLEKIIGAMLLYYSQTGQLPQKLADLLPLDGGLPLENPTHHPYVYHRDGLRSPGVNSMVVVNDPTVSVNGRRWCIIEVSPGKGTAIQLETRPIPENLFLGYQ